MKKRLVAAAAALLIGGGAPLLGLSSAGADEGGPPATSTEDHGSNLQEGPTSAEIADALERLNAGMTDEELQAHYGPPAGAVDVDPSG